MGTLQKRFDKPQLFWDEAASHLNRKITVVMNDNTVYFGTLLGIRSGEMEIENMRHKKTAIRLDRIREIYLDSNF